MYEYQLTIGLFDKDTAAQEVAASAAKNMIADLLLNRFGIYAFTMIECSGVYKMADGRIVSEPSLRLEIAADDCIDQKVDAFIAIIKDADHLNQESIMIKRSISDINFK